MTRISQFISVRSVAARLVLLAFVAATCCPINAADSFDNDPVGPFDDESRSTDRAVVRAHVVDIELSHTAALDTETELADSEGLERGGLFGWLDRPTLLREGNLVDHSFRTVFGAKEKLGFPLEVGGWHWFAIDTTGAGQGGYGLQNYRGTYAWTLRGGPEFQLSDTQTVGAYAWFAMRDGDPYRTYYPSNFWFLEAYGWYRDVDWGTFKTGLLFTRFGIGSYGNFIGTSPYFEGYIQDPDYGFSWENTWQSDDRLSFDTFAQFFLHEDGKNGSLAKFDSESVAGVTERDTGVLRGLAKYAWSPTSRFEAGASGLVGRIDSTIPGFDGNMRTVWGFDASLYHGPWAFRSEFLQRQGRVVPEHFVSGGPSDRMDAYSLEASYKTGPWTYRGKYSQSFLANPAAHQNNLSLGGQLDITANMHFFAEYVWWTVDHNALAGDFTVLEGPQLTVYWHY